MNMASLQLFALANGQWFRTGPILFYDVMDSNGCK